MTRSDIACSVFDGLCSGRGRAFFEKVTQENGQQVVEYLCSFHADMESAKPGVAVRVIGTGAPRP